MALNLIAPLHPREPKQAQTLLAVGEVGLKEWPELFLPRRLPAAKKRTASGFRRGDLY